MEIVVRKGTWFENDIVVKISNGSRIDVWGLEIDDAKRIFGSDVIEKVLEEIIAKVNVLECAIGEIRNVGNFGAIVENDEVVIVE
jgi:hypothetical protein